MINSNRSSSNPSKSQRSVSSKSNKKGYPNNCIKQFSIEQEQFRLVYRQSSPKKYQRNRRQQKENWCKRCETAEDKLRQTQEHFKKVIRVHNEEMCSLKLINEDLRFELESLHEKSQKGQVEIQKLRRTLMTFNKSPKDEGFFSQKKKQIQIGLSPIYSEKEPLKIMKISQKCLADIEEPTFSQLLARTPNISEIKPGISSINKEQKQNALRSQFERLISECSSTNNKYKKSTIRKQLVAIANQLSTLTNQEILIH